MAGVISGVKQGGSGVFGLIFVPPDAVLPVGSSIAWSASDPTIQLAPDPSDPTRVTVSVLSSNGSTSFTLGVSVSMPNVPTMLTASVSVPILPAENVPTGVDITQLS